MAYPVNTMQLNERFESDLSTDLVKRETIPNATLSSSEWCCIKPGSLVEDVLRACHISATCSCYTSCCTGDRGTCGDPDPSRGEEEGDNTKCNNVTISTMLHSDGQPFYSLITCGGSHRNVSIHNQTFERTAKAQAFSWIIDQCVNKNKTKAYLLVSPQPKPFTMEATIRFSWCTWNGVNVTHQEHFLTFPPTACTWGYLWHTEACWMASLCRVDAHSVSKHPWMSAPPQWGRSPRCWSCGRRRQSLGSWWYSPKTSEADCKIQVILYNTQ